MKRIKKENLPSILRTDDSRKTVDVEKLIKDYASCLEKQEAEKKQRARHRELAEHLLFRKGFDTWVAEQRLKAESKNDLNRIELFLNILNNNPQYKIETVIKYTIVSTVAQRGLIFNFDAIKSSELK